VTAGRRCLDAGRPVKPRSDAADLPRDDATHVLLTHHHYDQVCDVDEMRERWHACWKVVINPVGASDAGRAPDSATLGRAEHGCDKAGETLRSARWRCAR